LTKDEHDRMVHEFVGYLKKSGITGYSIEYPVRLDDRNLGFVDVIVWAWDNVFLFDIKSDSTDLSGDIQKIRRYAHTLGEIEPYRLRTIRRCLVYGSQLRPRILSVRNLFAGVRVLFLDETNMPIDLDGHDLKKIIEDARGRFPRLRKIFRIMISGM